MKLHAGNLENFPVIFIVSTTNDEIFLILRSDGASDTRYMEFHTDNASFAL